MAGNGRSGDRQGVALPILIVLAACGGFAPFAIDAYLPGLPAIAEEFGVSASLAQVTLTGFLLMLGGGQLILGPLSDRIGRRRVLLVGVAGAIVASMLCAVAPTIWILILGRLLQGAFGAAGVVLSRAIAADLAAGSGIARAFALLMSIQTLAPVIAPAVGGLLVPSFGWRSVFWLLALIGLATLIGVWRLVPESLPPEARSTGGIRAVGADVATLLRTPAYTLSVLLFVATFSILFSYVSASPFVLQRIIGLSEREYSVAFTLNSLALLIGNLVSARIVVRTGMMRLITCAMLGMMCAVGWLVIAVLVLGTPGWAILPGFFFVMLATGFGMPTLGAMVAEESGNRRGTGSAIMGSSQMCLGAVVAPLTGIGNGLSAVPMIVLMLIGVAFQASALVLLRRARAH